MSETIGDIVKVLDKLTETENKFHLWHEQNKELPPNTFILTLSNKLGFRRFLVRKEMSLKDAMGKAIKIDFDLCSNPIPDYCKRFIGYHYIDLSNLSMSIPWENNYKK